MEVKQLRSVCNQLLEESIQLRESKDRLECFINEEKKLIDMISQKIGVVEDVFVRNYSQLFEKIEQFPRVTLLNLPSFEATVEIR